MVGATAVGFVKNVIKLTGGTMKAIDYEEENTKRVTALELTGGPAHGGLTVLDWFAGEVMSVAADEWRWAGKDSDDTKYKKLAKKAYDIAEAMLAERNKRYTPQGTIKGVTGKTYGHN